MAPTLRLLALAALLGGAAADLVDDLNNAANQLAKGAVAVVNEVGNAAWEGANNVAEAAGAADAQLASSYNDGYSGAYSAARAPLSAATPARLLQGVNFSPFCPFATGRNSAPPL
jgi:hypothetical protein